MAWVFDSFFLLFGLGLLLVFAMALLSPLEALGWWAGWSKRQLEPDTPDEEASLPSSQETPAEHYAIYLTAIGGISTEDLSGRERHFLEGLEKRLPDLTIVSDVFPFSVTNNPLNGERQFAWLWQKLHNLRMGRDGGPLRFVLPMLIFVRNLFQVGVSGDPRYGPIYNVGIAKEILLSLLRHGYPLDSGEAITLMAWSGGGQIAVGAAHYLHKSLQAPVRVVSIGGVIADDPGIAYVDHLYQITGSKDNFPLIGDILYPGRWPLLRYSAWNQAKQGGKISFINPGPIHHTGKNDYFDRRATLPNGQSYLDKTIEIAADAIAGKVK